MQRLPEALAGRINDCDSSVIITADEGRRGGKTIPLKANVDAALRWKQDFSNRTDADMAIATQFCFEAAPVIRWAETLRANAE